jgi:hypothetical protein
MAFTYAVDFKETNTQYIFMDIRSTEFYPQCGGEGNVQNMGKISLMPRETHGNVCLF